MSPKVVKVCKTFLLADITSELFPALEKKFFQLRNDKKQDNTKKTGNQFNDYKFVQLCFYTAYIFLPLESVIKYRVKGR